MNFPLPLTDAIVSASCRFFSHDAVAQGHDQKEARAPGHTDQQRGHLCQAGTFHFLRTGRYPGI